MKKKTSFILTALCYIVPTMILGMAWHFILFKDTYDQLGIYNRAEPIIPLGFLSMIVQGIIIAYLYPFYHRGNSSMGKAIGFNLIIGLLMFSVSTLANGAKIEVTSMQTWLWVQTAFTLIQFLITGALIGAVNSIKIKH